MAQEELNDDTKKALIEEAVKRLSNNSKRRKQPRSVVIEHMIGSTRWYINSPEFVAAVEAAMSQRDAA